MKDLVLPAPAKLNLFLHITGRRADGYHELETLFQFLDFADEVHLSLRDDGIIEQGQALEGVPREDDLTIRAAELLQQKLGTHLGVRIDIHKRVPLGGGLGGGSSDAATTLLGLNRLWQGGLNLDQLADFGLALGADIPVFIHGHSALAKGVGEQLWPADPPCYWYLVLIPPVNVSTKEIFSLSALTRNSAPLKIPGFVQGIADASRGNTFWAQTRNDCQSVVSERYRGVQQALDWLEAQDTVWPGGRLTGTGACVFAAFAQKSTAERALSNCPTELGGFIAQGINISPVHDQLGEM